MDDTGLTAAERASLEAARRENLIKAATALLTDAGGAFDDTDLGNAAEGYLIRQFNGQPEFPQ